MAKKEKKVRPVRVRKPRRSKSERRAENMTIGAAPVYPDNYWHWLNSRHKAAEILNNTPERPYWASIEYNGNPPVSEYFPCTMYRRSDRWYYGFLERSHRDGFVAARYRDDARKEYTGADGRTPL